MNIRLANRLEMDNKVKLWNVGAFALLTTPQYESLIYLNGDFYMINK